MVLTLMWLLAMELTMDKVTMVTTMMTVRKMETTITDLILLLLLLLMLMLTLRVLKVKKRLMTAAMTTVRLLKKTMLALLLG